MPQSAESRRLQLGIAEILLSLATVAIAVLFPLLAIQSYDCAFGHCSTPSLDEALVYKVLVMVAAILVIATFVVAVRRGAQWSFAWHGLVTVMTFLSGLFFYVLST